MLRTFIPGIKVDIKKIQFDLFKYDLLLFEFPKWPFNCPPLNMFLEKMLGCKGKKFAVFMSYGGWDGDRYLDSLNHILKFFSMVSVGYLKSKRKLIRDETYIEKVGQFYSNIKKLI